jgi:hypothetical protein
MNDGIVRLPGLPGYNQSVVPANHPAEEAFDETFRPYGGRVVGPSSYGPLAGFVEYYRRRYWFLLRGLTAALPHDKRLASTYLGVIDNRNLNAIATCSHRFDLVGIYAGSIANLSVLYFMLLSHPEVLPHVGDVSKERAWFDDLSECGWTGPLANVMSRVKPRPDRIEFPKDPIRYVAAAQMGAMALDFLFLHEMGHLLLGHLDYLIHASGNKMVAEVRDEASLSSPVSHGIELQADEHACHISLGAAFGIDGSPDPQAFRSTTEALRRWTFAIGLLFLVFDRNDTAVVAHEWQDHPHSAVRLWNVSQMSDRAAGLSGRDPAELSEWWLQAVKDLGDVSLRFNLRSAVWHVAGTGFDKVPAALEQLNKAWSAIAPDLKRFNRL